MGNFGSIAALWSLHLLRRETGMRAKDAWERAAECAARAVQAADEHSRILFTKQRDSWIRIANHREMLDAAEAHGGIAEAHQDATSRSAGPSADPSESAWLDHASEAQ
jgi:hypothetical protein